MRKSMTEQEWNDTINAIKDAKGSRVEVSEEFYYNFFKSLPPVFKTEFWYNSEPLRHTEKGVVYYAFRQDGEKYYGFLYLKK